MSLPQDQVIAFKAAITEQLASDQINDWQRKFLTDMQSRLDQYGTLTRLSPKQFGILRKLTGVQPSEATSPPQDTAPEAPEPTTAAERPIEKPKRTAPARPKPPTKAAFPRPPSPLRTYRKARRSFREAKFVVFAVFAAIIAIGSLGGGPSSTSNSFTTRVAAPVASPAVPASAPTASKAPRFSITDGDTIKLYDGTAVRLVGFNTPETYKPQCDREYQLGKMATARLGELVRNASSINLQLVACACKPGTQGTRACNYGRSCGVLTVDGVDVGRTLISEGLAARFVCSPTSCPRLPSPWCG